MRSEAPSGAETFDGPLARSHPEGMHSDLRATPRNGPAQVSNVLRAEGRAGGTSCFPNHTWTQTLETHLLARRVRSPAPQRSWKSVLLAIRARTRLLLQPNDTDYVRYVAARKQQEKSDGCHQSRISKRE
jgi:hypothetical protein